jgi:hypothetical protein
MAGNGSPAYTDAQILEMLDMRDRLGLSAAEIAPRFGVTKMAIIGVLHRVKTEAGRVGNADLQDGTMPKRWWVAGIAKRGLQNVG